MLNAFAILIFEQHVYELVQSLVKAGIDPNEIGVTTPYAAQVRLLKKLMGNELSHKIECSSIDGFQGREKKIMIVSTVRSKFKN